MKNIIFTILAIGFFTVEASTLKTDEFDVYKIGTTFEKYIVQVDNRFKKIDKRDYITYDMFKKELDNQTKILNKEIKKLQQRIITLEKDSKNKHLKKNKDNTNYINIIQNDLSKIEDIQLVVVKIGIIAYSKPFGFEEYFVKKYKYGTHLSIEKCDKYGWCKILNKDEYVANHLLKK
jgi:hypothetical protein